MKGCIGFLGIVVVVFAFMISPVLGCIFLAIFIAYVTIVNVIAIDKKETVILTNQEPTPQREQYDSLSKPGPTYSNHTLVGMQYRSLGSKDIGVHTTAIAKAEMDNQYDACAVGIWNGSKLVGYVAQSENEGLHRRLIRKGGTAAAQYKITVGNNGKFYGYCYIEDQTPEDIRKDRTFKSILKDMKNNEHKTLDYVAIDFEIAMSKNQMPCQIGLAVVKDGLITEQISRYIQPPENKYSLYCTRVHGITPDMTKDAPLFPQVWAEIKQYFDGSFVVAHNASFDMTVLAKALEYYNLGAPEITGYACTCEIFDKAKLTEVCAAYDIAVDCHHDALCDAVCCAKVYTEYAQGHAPLHEIVKTPSETKAKKTPVFDESELSGHKALRGDVLKKDLSNADPSNPFYDKKVVITGVFSMDREDMAQWLKRMGADIDTAISKKTQIVLVGEKAGPKKLEKIAQLQEAGSEIKVYHEDFILQTMEQYK